MWLPLLSALAGIVAFLPMNFYPAVFVFLVPLFIFFLREKKLWRLITGAILFRLMFGLGTAYFTLEPLLWISSLLIFCGLPISIWAIKKLFSRLHLTPYLLQLLFLPFAWTFFDLLQARFSLVPTYIITAGNALGSSPFLGLALRSLGVGGLVTLTFFVAVINTLITSAILQRGNRRNIIFLIATIAILLFFAWRFSSFELRKNSFAYDSLPNSFTVAAVSTDGTFTADSFKGLVQELASRKTDLVVFPEDMFNQSVMSDLGGPTSDVGPPRSYTLGNPSTLAFQNLAKELNTPVLAVYDTFQDGKKYNSVILFDAQGNIAGIHNKSRLTFLGEYWPFGDWYPSLYDWLKKENPGIGNYALFNPKNADSSGERNLLSITFGKNPILFAAPICLEVQYQGDLKEYRANGARFIVNQSSNRWVSIGLYHYLHLTDNLKKIEAVWLGVPIISSGVDDNAGITLPDGQTINAQTSDKNYAVFFGTIRY